MAQKRPDLVMSPVKIAEAFYHLHTQEPVVLDTRASVHTISDQAELLTVRFRIKMPAPAARTPSQTI
jgi:hypothetical protein